MNHAFSEKIRSVLHWVWRHPKALFYRAKYARSAYDPFRHFRGVEDLWHIPLLEKSELIAAKWQDLLFQDFRAGTYITFTSGTTRHEPLALFRAREEEERCWSWLRGEQAPRVKRLMILMLPHTILKYHPLAERYGIMPLMGDITNLANAARLAAHFEIDGLHGLPALAIQAAPHLAAAYDCGRFRIISTVGEKVTAAKKALLCRMYPQAALYSYYSSAETGTMGYQCAVIGKSTTGNIYHFDQDKFFPEVLEPTTGESLPHGKAGELVITHLRQAPTPLIRFRTGDAATLLDRTCGCGDPNPLLRVEGRIGFDTVRAGGFEFRLESFEEAVAQFPQALHFQFQVDVSEIIGEETVMPRISWQLLPRQYPLSPAAEHAITHTLMKQTQISPRYTLEGAVTAHLMAPPSFRFVQELPHSYKTRGLRFVENA